MVNFNNSKGLLPLWDFFLHTLRPRCEKTCLKSLRPNKNKGKKGGKNQESIQSSATPDPG